MPNYSFIELWVDKRKLKALEESLQERGSSVEEHMLAFFQGLYHETVPFPIQAKIERETQEETTRMAAKSEECRKVTAYRMTRDGQSGCFRTGIGSDILMTALRLKQYLSGPAAAGFEEMLSDRTEITEDDFDQLAILRMDGAEKIVGIYDIDFDRMELSCVDPGVGWHTFPMDSVYTAMQRAEQKQGLSHEQMREVLMNNLEGWAIPSPRHLPMCAFEFEHEIDIAAERLIFQIDTEAYFDSLDAVFRTNTCTPENNDFLTIRACYNTAKSEVCGILEVTLNHDGESYADPNYVLSGVERVCLQKKMDGYCRQMTGMGLTTYSDSLYKPQPESTPFGPMSDVELMQLYAETCIADMAKKNHRISVY